MQEDAVTIQAQATEPDLDGAPDGDGPGGQVQNAPLARATRKRLTALHDDLLARLANAGAAHPPSVDLAREATGSQLADVAGRRIVALLRAHRATGDAAPLAQAKALAASANPGRGSEAHLGELSALGLAFVHLHDCTGSDLHLDAAERLADAVRRLEAPRGGFRTTRATPNDALEGGPNGTAARFLVELSWRIGSRGGHRDAAEKAIRRLCVPPALDAQPHAHGDLLDGVAALLAEPLHATVTGPWENPAVARLHRACLRLEADPLVLDWSPANDDFPHVGAPCVYMSRGSRCASPVTDEALLTDAVARLALP